MKKKQDLHVLGKLLGREVYIDLYGLKGRVKDKYLEEARLFHEQSFKNHDFLNEIRDFFKIVSPN